MNKKNGLSAYRRKKVVEAFCADLTATQSAKVLGLNRNTVNRYFRIFRERIREHQTGLKDQFRGTVEVDESWFGAARPRGRLGPHKVGRGPNKQPVFGIIERGGRVFTEIIEDTTKATLQGLIRGHVAQAPLSSAMAGAAIPGLSTTATTSTCGSRNTARKATPSPRAMSISMVSRASGASPRDASPSSTEPAEPSSCTSRNVSGDGARTTLPSSLNSHDY